MTTIADSWWVRVTCDGERDSGIKKAGDPYNFNLTSSGKAPEGTVNCSVCYTPILDVPSWSVNTSGYPECEYFQHTLAKECRCFVMPTNPGQGANLEQTSSRTERGAPCEGYSEFFDLALGLLTLTGPDAGGAYTAEGTPPDPGAYCTGCSGTKTREDLCGCGNPPIQEKYDGTGGDPSYTDWNPPEDSVCAGTPFEQWRQLAEGGCRACGGLDLGPNPAVGTMLPDWTEWHPRTDLSQVCSDAPGITQYRYDRNGCADREYEEQTVYGTKNCDCECPPGWSVAMPASDVVTGEPCPEGETLQTAGGSGDNPCDTCYKCGCIDFQSYSEVHGFDECPDVLGQPCFPSGTGSCASLTITGELVSREFSNNCKIGKIPKADVSASFDDFGYIGSLSCNETAICADCGVQGTITPEIESVGSDKFKLKIPFQATNAYWGGPYGITCSARFYFE